VKIQRSCGDSVTWTRYWIIATSKTAKITKRWYYWAGDVGNITFFKMIFAVLDLGLSLAVNLCINCSFYIIICRNQAIFLALFACYCSISNSYFSFFINSRWCCNSGHSWHLFLAMARFMSIMWPEISKFGLGLQQKVSYTTYRMHRNNTSPYCKRS